MMQIRRVRERENQRPAQGHTFSFRGNASACRRQVSLFNLKMIWTCWIICFRNLKRLVRVPLRKGRKRNRRKRARDDFQGSRVAKQQRLNSGHRPLHINNQPSVSNSDSSSFYTTSSQSTSSGFECWSEQEKDGPEDAQTTEAISSSVSLEEPTKPQEVKVKPKVPKTTAGFRDLLAQMRGNSSMIFRETHYWGDSF